MTYALTRLVVTLVGFVTVVSSCASSNISTLLLGLCLVLASDLVNKIPVKE